MSGTLMIDREALNELEQRLESKIPGACMTIMLRLLVDACYAPTTTNNIALQRGQIYIGRDKIRTKTGLSPKTIRNALDVLRKQGEISTERTIRRGQRFEEQGANEGANAANIITLLHYDTYDAAFRKGANEGALDKNTKGPQKKKELLPEDTIVSSAAPSGAPDPPIDQTPTSKNGKRNDYADECARLWRQIVPNGRVEYSLFGKWRKEYGPSEPIAVMKQIVLSGKKITGSAQGYIAKALTNRQDERERNGIEAEPWTPPEGFEYLMEEPS